MGSILRRTWADTRGGMEKPLFWVAALIIAAPTAVIVGAALPDGSLGERALGGLVAGIATFILLLVCWVLFNLLHAGNRNTIDAAHKKLEELRGQVPTEPPPRIPKNRDALIATVTAMERAVLDALSYGKMIEEMRAKNPAARIDLDKQKFQACHDVWRELELQERLAGQEFGPGIQMYRHLVGFAADDYLIADLYPRGDGTVEQIGKDKHEQIYADVRLHTKEFLRKLDAGELYQPKLAALLEGKPHQKVDP